MSERRDDPAGHEQLLAAVAVAGCSARDTSGDFDAEWSLHPPGTCRSVYVRLRDDGTQCVYSIYVEEFRGGEGYEDEELRTTELSEVLEAIPIWAKWAQEPFVKSAAPGL